MDTAAVKLCATWTLKDRLDGRLWLQDVRRLFVIIEEEESFGEGSGN